MYVVVAYDVTDDRRRARLAKKLTDFLPRAQHSLFEGELPESRFEALREIVREEIDPDHDRARVYRLCRRCVAGVEEHGAGWAPGGKERDVIL